MNFVPYRLLRNKPADLRQKLKDEGELVITVDGKPFAVMINLADNENMEELFLLLSRLRAQMAARSILSQAQRNGTAHLDSEQIDDLVRKTRAERAR